MPNDRRRPQWSDYEKSSSESGTDNECDAFMEEEEPFAEIARLRKDAKTQRAHFREILRRHKAHDEEVMQNHRAEIADATSALARQEHLTESMNALRLKHKPIHDVALHLVFDALFPLEGLLDPGISRGPNSPWSRAIRMRKAIALVCRQWHEVGYPFLYRDIVLRRVGQVAALYRTLQDAPRYGARVQTLTLLFPVPTNMVQFATTTVSDILGSCNDLIGSCPSLQSLALGPTFSSSLDCGNYVESLPFSLTAGFHAAAKRVRKLEYNWEPWELDTSHSPVFWHHIRDYTHLTHLTICIPPVNRTPPGVSFKSLQVLVLSHVKRQQDLQTLCSWKFPKLDQLRFRPSIDSTRIPRSFVEFVSQQTSLGVLDAGCSTSCLVVGNDVGEASPSMYDCLYLALGACPSIQRLVIPARDGKGRHVLDSPLGQVQLEHVDVWTPIQDSRLPCLIRSLPWRSVRLLDSGLNTVIDLPHLLSPWSPAQPQDFARGVYVHDVFGMRLVDTARSILRHDQPWPHALGEGNIYGVEHSDFDWDAKPDDDEHDDSEQEEDDDSSNDSDFEDVSPDEWSEGEESEETSDSEVSLHYQTTSAEALGMFTAQLNDWD